jgi:integrase
VTGKRTDDRTMRDGVKRRCHKECPARGCRNGRHTWAYVVAEPAPNGGRGRKVWRGGFASERDAQAARRAAQHQIDQRTYVRPAVETLASVAPRWLASLQANGRKPSTLNAYDSDLRLYLLPTLGARPIARITAADIEALYAELVVRGLSVGTVQRAAAVIGGLLAQAKRWRLIPANPASDARVPRSAQSARPGEAAPLDRAKVWTEQQLARFLRHVADAPDGPMWTVAAATGARRGELAALRWPDVDLDVRAADDRQAGRPVPRPRRDDQDLRRHTEGRPGAAGDARPVHRDSPA